MTPSLRIGVIADTHGLLRPEALEALQGCDVLLHLGDIGSPGILDSLRALAPLHVVRGNNDTDAWADAIPETLELEFAGVRLYLIHDRKQLPIDAQAAGIDIVLSGHSHKPLDEVHDGVRHFNPGSAGPRRFSLPISVGRLVLERGEVMTELIELPPALASGRQGQKS
ncbi:metallophosphoesterase family protein [Pseudomonas sp. LRF_L74]|uniref:metallophosphoesterase family protein n=1 Tax=Pseudomonas sp. LRF_L74 TaxID=3369422 RepID=UPI003F5EA655